MEEHITKPDIVLVTKNVMVPLALPSSANKIAVGSSALKKKTKIAKMRRNKLSESQTLSYFHNNNCKSLESQKKKECLERESEASYNVLYDKEYVDNCKNFQSLHDLEKTTKNLINQSDLEKTTNFEREFDTKYKIPCNHEFIITRDGPLRSNGKPMISSLSLPGANSPKLICPSSHDTMLLPNVTRSLEFRDKSSQDEKSSFSEIYLQEGFKEDCKIKRKAKSFNNKIPFQRNNSTEQYNSYLSSDINSKFCHSPESPAEGAEHYDKCEIKYSWEDLENWIPPSEKKNLESSEKRCKVFVKAVVEDKNLDCRMKYSWQIIGTGVQTSEDLIQSLVGKEKEDVENYPCTVKYSWQIIGTGTQVSFRENAKYPSRYERDYWQGKILKGTTEPKNLTTRIGVSPKCKILYNEKCQTTSDKVLQADTSNCEVKYSWQNLTKPYLQITKNLKKKYPPH